LAQGCHQCLGRILRQWPAGDEDVPCLSAMGQGCCKIESLSRAKTSISHAQVAGVFPGIQPFTDYTTLYEELQLVTTTSASSRSRVSEIRGISSGLRYVCRRCPFEEAPLHHEPEALALHLEAMCELDHPHLCKLVECFTDEESGDYLLVSEQAHQPTLLDYVEEHGLPNGDIDAADCVRQILSALALGHSRGIAHGRLRHDCILVSAPAGAQGSPTRESGRKSKNAVLPGDIAPQVKICDMGLGYALRDPISLATANYEGILYMSPEHAWAEYELDEAHHDDPAGDSEEPLLKITSASTGESTEAAPETSPLLAIEDSAPKNNVIPHWSTPKGGAAPPGADKVDVWAVGVLTFNLLSGALPFEASDEEQLTMHIRCHRPKFAKDPWADISTKAYGAVDMMLKLSPELRPTAIDMLRHPWLRLSRKKVSQSRKYNLYRSAIVNLQEGQFKKLVNRIITEQLSGSHVHRVEALEVFRALDKDRDGLLNYEEFTAALMKLPDLEKLTDPQLLFEAIDRNRSGTLDANEFLAATLPPSETRDDKILIDAFRAFDTNESGSITVDEVSNTVRTLEGPLMSAQQIDELCASIVTELESLGFGANLMVSLGLHDHDDDSAFGKIMESMGSLLPCGGRRLDFGEFVYLCSIRQSDFKTTSWVKKEAYRVVDVCCDVDMYHQTRAGTPKWPPRAGAHAQATMSVYEKRGLASDSEKRKVSRAKSSHRYSTAAGESKSPSGSARVSSRGTASHQRKSRAHFAPTHHGHHLHHHDQAGHPEHHHHHGGHHADGTNVGHHHHHHHHHHGKDADSARQPASPGWEPGSPSASTRASATSRSAKESSRPVTAQKKPRKHTQDYDSEVESDDDDDEEDP